MKTEIKYYVDPKIKDIITDNDLELITDEVKSHPTYSKFKTATLFITESDGYIGYEVLEETQRFDRIRRITGYLTGTVDRWNNAKKHELQDRVKHIK